MSFGKNILESILMKPPLILIEGGDLTVFRSKTDLERYVESPDIHYYRVFDSQGAVLELSVSANESDPGLPGVAVLPVRLTIPGAPQTAREELATKIVAFLGAVAPHESTSDSSLERLIERLVGVVGFTR